MKAWRKVNAFVDGAAPWLGGTLVVGGLWLYDRDYHRGLLDVAFGFVLLYMSRLEKRRK